MRSLFLLLFPAFCATGWTREVVSVRDFGAAPGGSGLQTQAFQAAIDAAAESGGRVEVPEGVFVVGGLNLRSNVELHLARGAVLQGSADYRDYGSGGKWTDALLAGVGVRRVRISGPGVIEGSNVERPGGEEGFRGPHTIYFVDSEEVAIEDVTIQNSGNYAILCRQVAGLHVARTRILGGHDGLHIQACRNVEVTDTDFRTGDDCVAGTDNQQVTFSRCYFNSACNAFRLGASGLVVRDSKFQGPGEFAHRISLKKAGTARHSMGAAFVHFAPKDRHPQIPSDDWLIENCVVDGMDRLYGYDFERGLWQTGQPARRIVFRNVQGTNLKHPIRVVGDSGRQLHLILDTVRLETGAGLSKGDEPVIEARQFGSLELRRSALLNDGQGPLVRAMDGHHLTISPPLALEDVEILHVESVDEAL